MVPLAARSGPPLQLGVRDLWSQSSDAPLPLAHLLCCSTISYSLVTAFPKFQEVRCNGGSALQFCNGKHNRPCVPQQRLRVATSTHCWGERPTCPATGCACAG